ncbi:MAG: transporter substrate-binding protein [Novosphingobium sp.]|nr:transporter substrate-binding protein [Novosphingobium sp.]
MSRLLVLGVLAALLAIPASAKVRVASMGLCADQMAIMLADRGQIASVSAEATGPLSQLAAQARGLPINRGSAEELIASRADVLLTSTTVNKQTQDALRKFGVRVFDLPFANSWAEVEAMTRQAAAELGQRVRGEAVIADMRRRLARAAPKEPRSAWPTVVYYRPDMGGAGAGTFVDVSLTAAGWNNLQATWGPPLWSGVPVERVVLTPPDAFAVSYFDTNRNGGSVLRRNPVLWGSARTRPVLNVPGRFWNCGSPLLVEAVELLAAERAKLLARRRR